jgi:hypothetical protein
MLPPQGANCYELMQRKRPGRGWFLCSDIGRRAAIGHWTFDTRSAFISAWNCGSRTGADWGRPAAESRALPASGGGS